MSDSIRSRSFGSRSAFVPSFIIAITTIIMLAWSWQTWCDPLVDFGTQLYVPWQMTLGKMPYRDMAYFNGPLSQYLHAGLFLIFGVSLRTLVFANLAVLLGVLVLIYRLAARASSRLAATACCVTFVLLFAFGQGVGVANFNWVTPYTNEITHGIALGLVAITLLDRYLRCGKRAWLAASGAILGLVFLTKAEPFVGTLTATTAMLAAKAWTRGDHLAWTQGDRLELTRGGGLSRHRIGDERLRTSEKIIHNPTSSAPLRVAADPLIDAVIFFGTAVAIPLIALGLMSLQMPITVAARGVAGSWPWVFDRRVTALPFYREVAGTDDLAGSVATILWWTLAYVGLLGLSLLLAFGIQSKRRSVAVVIFLIGAMGMIILSQCVRIDWNSIIRPLAICLLVILIFAAVPILFRRGIDDRTLLRFGLVVFAMAMLAKISLNARIFHYGFALAMPGVLVLVAVIAEELPHAINRRGGNGDAVRAIGGVCWGTAVFVTLYVDHLFFAQKQFVLGHDGDAMLASARGMEIATLVDQIQKFTPANATVTVLPQGLMINYLARRADAIPNLNFMPPEVLAAGEDRIIESLTKTPPEVILVNSSAVEGDAFTLDHKYSYGKKTLDWVRRNYFIEQLPTAGKLYGFVFMVRRK